MTLFLKFTVTADMPRSAAELRCLVIVLWISGGRYREYTSELHGTLIVGDGEFHDEKARTHPTVGTESDGVNASAERCASTQIRSEKHHAGATQYRGMNRTDKILYLRI